MIHSFTHKYNGYSRDLTLPVKIKLRGTDGFFETQGIIDTGATASVISENIAVQLNAIPQTYTKVHTASEQNVITPLYEADIEICQQVNITGLTVTSGALLYGSECLIGMDILSQGYLAVTNFNGKTCVSFRIPSVQCIDFVESAKASKPIVSTKIPGRNDLCPCGSGKKYKHCCGN
jgi:predicted aspartyl protease